MYYLVRVLFWKHSLSFKDAPNSVWRLIYWKKGFHKLCFVKSNPDKQTISKQGHCEKNNVRYLESYCLTAGCHVSQAEPPWTNQQGEFLLCKSGMEIKGTKCLLLWIFNVCHRLQTFSVCYFVFFFKLLNKRNQCLVFKGLNFSEISKWSLSI